MDRTQLTKLWPKTPGRTSQAVTGRIPMRYFEDNEQMIRNIMRTEWLKLFYRGPRLSNRGSSRSRTRRCDATHVVLSA
jgi:hypothetical protein